MRERPRSAPAHLGTRELLLIVFFATFLVAMRVAMRWHLHVPGHAMLASAFGLVLVRSCVDRRSAASICGVLAGIAVAALGMGKGGPLIILKLALPGAVIDLGTRWWSRKRRPISIPFGGLLGGLAGATTLTPTILVEWIAGVDSAVIGIHVLGSGAGKVLFGIVGGSAAAWVAQQLDHHGLLRDEPRAHKGQSEMPGVP